MILNIDQIRLEEMGRGIFFINKKYPVYYDCSVNELPDLE